MDVVRDDRMLREQLEEIRSAPRASDKASLGTKYGINPLDVNSSLLQLDGFDMTK